MKHLKERKQRESYYCFFSFLRRKIRTNEIRKNTVKDSGEVKEGIVGINDDGRDLTWFVNTQYNI